MRPDFIRRRITTWLLLPISLLAGCNDAARPVSRSTTSQPAPASSQGDLPQWLQQGPADWSDEVWKEYQAALIRSRAPMLRSQDYSVEELQVVTAEVEHFPGEYEDKLKDEWLEKWRSRLQSFELTGGCGCCNEIYTVIGPKAAIAEFPPRPTCLSTSSRTEGDASSVPASAPPTE